MLKYFFIFCLIGATWQFFSNRATKAKAQLAAVVALAKANPTTPSAGFVFMPAPKNAPTDKVVIVTPPDSPQIASLRAEALLAELGTAGIPCIRIEQLAFAVNSATDAESIHAFMSSAALPVIFIREKACANPALAQIVDEYKRSTPK